MLTSNLQASYISKTSIWGAIMLRFWWGSPEVYRARYWARAHKHWSNLPRLLRTASLYVLFRLPERQSQVTLVSKRELSTWLLHVPSTSFRYMYSSWWPHDGCKKAHCLVLVTRIKILRIDCYGSVPNLLSNHTFETGWREYTDHVRVRVFGLQNVPIIL